MYGSSKKLNGQWLVELGLSEKFSIYLFDDGNFCPIEICDKS